MLVLSKRVRAKIRRDTIDDLMALIWEHKLVRLCGATDKLFCPQSLYYPSGNENNQYTYASPDRDFLRRYLNVFPVATTIDTKP